jgi:Protein of unknown function (DUF2939)
MKILIGTCCAAALWFASPYFALYNFVMALKAGDQPALEKQVSWPDVRLGLKEDFGAMLAEKLAADPKLKDNPFSGLGAVFGSAIVDRLIDIYVTPRGLAALIQAGKLAPQGVPSPRSPETDRPVTGPVVRWAFFNGLASFLLVLENESGTSKPLKVVMNFQNFSWKVVRVYLPLEQTLRQTSSRAP